MSKRLNWQGMGARVGAGLALATLFVVQVAAWGGEPAQVCPVQECMKDCCPSTFLTKIPYLGRLFVNRPPCTTPACNDGVERIGIDFDVCESMPAQWSLGSAGGDCQKCFAIEVITGKACEGKACEAQACGCPGKRCTSKESCAASCEKAQCPAAKGCVEQRDVKCNAKCEAQCEVAARCPAEAIWSGPMQHPLLTQVIALSSQKAALEAALGAQASLLEQKAEMLEAFAALAAEKARLEAQLELQTEREAATGKLLELAQENARLKAQLELADAKTALLQQVAQVSIENESLKLQVAQLKLKSEKSEASVSKRSAGDRKLR